MTDEQYAELGKFVDEWDSSRATQDTRLGEIKARRAAISYHFQNYMHGYDHADGRFCKNAPADIDYLLALLPAISGNSLQRAELIIRTSVGDEYLNPILIQAIAAAIDAARPVVVSADSQHVARQLVSDYYAKGAMTATSDVWLINRIAAALEEAKPKVSKDDLQAARLLVVTSVGHEFENELLIRRIAEYGASQRPKVSEDDEQAVREILKEWHKGTWPESLVTILASDRASVRDAARLAGEQGLREVAYFLEPHFHGAKGRHMTAREAIALIKDISSDLDDTKDALEVAVLAERKRIREAVEKLRKTGLGEYWNGRHDGINDVLKAIDGQPVEGERGESEKH